MIWEVSSPKTKPRYPPDELKMAQDGPRWPKMSPRWPKMCPRWPKMAQDGPKMAQDGPKMPPNDPKVGLNIVIFQKMEDLPCENAI